MYPDLSNRIIDPPVARIAFSKIKGINFSTASRLLGMLGSPEQFFTMQPAALQASCGIDRRICDTGYRQSLLDAAEQESIYIKSKSISARFVGDDGYPRRLADCDDAPAMLYSVGPCNLNCLHSVAIVGTRHATPYGLDFVKHLVADLAATVDSLVIVSGLAYGIDVAAHRAALENGIPTVAVVAHGLNTIYPADHRDTAAHIVSQGGAIVTEYTSDSTIHRGNFLARNRIVAGLCDCTVVVESAAHGGALATARIASDYNRDVFAVPGRLSDPYSAGTNRLIASRTASLLPDADFLIQAMGWTPAAAPANEEPRLFRPVSDEEQRLLDIVAANPTFTSADIAAALAMPYARVADMLFRMEMDDMLISIPGGRYALPNY